MGDPRQHSATATKRQARRREIRLGGRFDGRPSLTPRAKGLAEYEKSRTFAMALSIKDRETECLARSLAERAGERASPWRRGARSRNACGGLGAARAEPRSWKTSRRFAAAGARCRLSIPEARTKSSVMTNGLPT